MNWKEGLENRMSSGRVISPWLSLVSANICLTFGAGNLQPSWLMDIYFFSCVHITINGEM